MRLRIRRGLGSRRLPCGCAVGLYETYREEIVLVVDARHPQCRNPRHYEGATLPEGDREALMRRHEVMPGVQVGP